MHSSWHTLPDYWRLYLSNYTVPLPKELFFWNNSLLLWLKNATLFFDVMSHFVWIIHLNDYKFFADIECLNWWCEITWYVHIHKLFQHVFDLWVKGECFGRFVANISLNSLLLSVNTPCHTVNPKAFFCWVKHCVHGWRIVKSIHSASSRAVAVVSVTVQRGWTGVFL